MPARRWTEPATAPFAPATKSASETDTRRVRLLSMAQHRQATTGERPIQSFVPASPPDQTTPPARHDREHAEHDAPVCVLLKTTQAITAVSTASRFSSSEAVHPPCARQTEHQCKRPDDTTEEDRPSSHRHSPLSDRKVCPARSRTSRTAASPNPPEVQTREQPGDIAPTSNLANGVLAPNKAAASSAWMTWMLFMSLPERWRRTGSAVAGKPPPRWMGRRLQHALDFA